LFGKKTGCNEKPNMDTKREPGNIQEPQIKPNKYIDLSAEKTLTQK
jgi:hypothetical protein